MTSNIIEILPPNGASKAKEPPGNRVRLRKKLLILAEKIVDDVLREPASGDRDEEAHSIPLSTKLDALKIAGQFLISDQKSKKGDDDDDDQPEDFGRMKKRLNAASNRGE